MTATTRSTVFRAGARPALPVLLAGLVLAGCFKSSTSSGSKEPPVITAHPANMMVAEGAGATFTVTAAGAVSYQWIRGESDTLAGEVLPVLVLQNVTAGMNGNTYKCVAINAHGSAVSNAASLGVYDSLHVPRQALLDSGAVFFQICAGCHGPDGQGGMGPPLRHSDFVMAEGHRHRLIRIPLIGLPNYVDTAATIVVNGDSVTNNMYAAGAELTNFELAAVLTYIRVVLNDSLSVNCIPPTDTTAASCQKVARSATEIANDSIAVWEVKAVRDTLDFDPWEP